MDYLERSFRHNEAAITFVYFEYKEQENQSAINILASLLQQLVQVKAVIPEGVMALYRRNRQGGSPPTLEEISGLLLAEARNFVGKFFIIIDALDECSELNGTRIALLGEIRKLQRISKILITSRETAAIEHELACSARLEICANDHDIGNYVERRIMSETRLARWVVEDEALRKTIFSTLVKNAQGMYVLLSGNHAAHSF